jgi:endonuclease/exonuclease/phosphatase family metal-dependent hydrolase
MKRTILFGLFFLTAFSFCIFSSNAQTHQIATFNIRWANPNDSGNLWTDRLPHVAGLIQFHKIGIVGIQEGLITQVNDMTQALGYSYLGVGRDDGKDKGEFSAILYDSQQFTVLDQGTFWLSETPDIPSKGWDAALNRICTYGKFKDQAGKEFYVFNIHYDHVGQKAREESSKLVVKKAKEINKENLPALFMGDFNVDSSHPGYLAVVNSGEWKDARLISEIPAYGPQGSFTGFDWETMPDKIIDHVFVHGTLKVIRHGILSDNYGKKYPSDHFPAMVEVEF